MLKQVYLHFIAPVFLVKSNFILCLHCIQSDFCTLKLLQTKLSLWSRKHSWQPPALPVFFQNEEKRKKKKKHRAQSRVCQPRSCFIPVKRTENSLRQLSAEVTKVLQSLAHSTYSLQTQGGHLGTHEWVSEYLHYCNSPLNCLLTLISPLSKSFSTSFQSNLSCHSCWP